MTVSVQRHDALRSYGYIRTAHLERFKVMVPADVLFTKNRYDYDESQADAGARPVRMSRLGVVKHLLRHRYRVVEVNEPMASNRWLDVLAQVVAIRLRGGFGRGRTRIAAYCIGYSDPAREMLDKRSWMPFAVARATSWAVGNVLVRSVDRLAFGTAGSYEMYAGYVGRRALAKRSAMFEALPAPCECDEGVPDDTAANRLIFVGSFQDRKGIRQLMAGWNVLRGKHSQYSLQLVGKGPLLDEVTAWAADRPEVRLDADPPRAFIHASMRNAKALVLLSQRVGGWREQIGLPLVEGLSHGLEIVATEETGLAPWLSAHGHVVLAYTAEPSEIADGLVRALQATRSKSEVLHDLPAVDQRIEADRWMLLPEYPLTPGNAVR